MSTQGEEDWQEPTAPFWADIIRVLWTFPQRNLPRCTLPIPAAHSDIAFQAHCKTNLPQDVSLDHSTQGSFLFRSPTSAFLNQMLIQLIIAFKCLEIVIYAYDYVFIKPENSSKA